ncbi:MAG: hypothetical protein WC997_17095 [Porticoccaceae bacterium]
MTPSLDKILQCMQYTHEHILMPNIQDDYARSQSHTMLNLFRYARQLAEHEARMLWEENRQIEQLLARVATYLASLPESSARDDLVAELGTPLPAPDDGYPGIAYLNACSHLLKQRLEDALGFLVAFPAELKKNETYQDIRRAIREFLVDNIQREDVLMTASFTSKRR